jgi:hypothetical protein
MSVLDLFDVRYDFNVSNPVGGGPFGAPRTVAASPSIGLR